MTALTPNPMNMVAKMLAAMRREGDWDKLEVAILCRMSLDGCVESVVGQYSSGSLALRSFNPKILE